MKTRKKKKKARKTREAWRHSKHAESLSNEKKRFSLFNQQYHWLIDCPILKYKIIKCPIDSLKFYKKIFHLAQNVYHAVKKNVKVDIRWQERV